LAFEQIKASKDISKHQDFLVYLLCDYSDLGETQRAKECLSLIDINPLVDYSAFACLAFAQYYESTSKNDSATLYCKRILKDGTDIQNMYDAAKLLYRICKKTGNREGAGLYADIYMQLSDSLDFGKRQELAATVNNEYQYHLDQKKEQRLKDEKEKYKNTLFMVCLAAILLLGLSYILHVRRRNRLLQEVVTLSSELQRVSDDDKQLRADIAKKEQELKQSKKSLAEYTDELANVKRELLRVNVELSEHDEALKNKEQQLAEKMDQNKTFIKLLHQSELEEKAEDVIHAIRQSSTGKKYMKSADWKQLYQAIDELYPLFKNRLLIELGTFTEQQMQVCYLMRAGLSKPQIQNMTNLSRVTVWRWVKKYDWVLTPDEDSDSSYFSQQNK
jgi:outer membrane murein-binding lipoprotein Lpp